MAHGQAGRIILRTGATYFALVLGAGFALGSVRVPFLVPRLGERWPELAEMPIMLGLIVLAARWVVAHFGLPPATGPRLVTGRLALAWLVAELGRAVLIQNQPPAAYIASRDPVSGSVYLAMLGLFALFALMPLILARWGAGRPVNPG